MMHSQTIIKFEELSLLLLP